MLPPDLLKLIAKETKKEISTQRIAELLTQMCLLEHNDIVATTTFKIALGWLGVDVVSALAHMDMIRKTYQMYVDEGYTDYSRRKNNSEIIIGILIIYDKLSVHTQ